MGGGIGLQGPGTTHAAGRQHQGDRTRQTTGAPRPPLRAERASPGRKRQACRDRRPIRDPSLSLMAGPFKAPELAGHWLAPALRPARVVRWEDSQADQQQRRPASSPGHEEAFGASLWGHGSAGSVITARVKARGVGARYSAGSWGVMRAGSGRRAQLKRPWPWRSANEANLAQGLRPPNSA